MLSKIIELSCAGERVNMERRCHHDFQELQKYPHDDDIHVSFDQVMMEYVGVIIAMDRLSGYLHQALGHRRM